MKQGRFQRWTPADEERLRRLAAEGRTSVTIAERLKRSVGSVRYRAKQLRVSFVKAKGK